MTLFSRREFLALPAAGAIAAAASRFGCAEPPAPRPGVQEQLLALAAQQEQQRRARFAAVKTAEQVVQLQSELREAFLKSIGGRVALTPGEAPAVIRTGHIEAEDYVIDQLVFESRERYFVPALLYQPKKIDAPCPAVLSPCGHSPTGKAADSYQILHVNLARQGYVVLTYDPVGQGERSQFWDEAKGKSRFNLTCGEHAVLGNPLYLLGTSLAHYRIYDGIRGLDYLASLPQVDAKRIGCAGNSGGGTLTAYIAALDPRIVAAAICCYITTLRRRMGNRIEADPDSDPEQDPFGFVSEGVDHAGLLALRAPRPTLLGTARDDFFPIEGARESFDEARSLFRAAGAEDRIQRIEAPERHGLTKPLREGIYHWFGRWLQNRADETARAELPVTPRPAKELQVCREGQVNVSYRSRHLFDVAREDFERTRALTPHPVRPLQTFSKDPQSVRERMLKILSLDLKSSDYVLTELSKGRAGKATLLYIRGNEANAAGEDEAAPRNREEAMLKDVAAAGYGTAVIEPRGVGSLRHKAEVRGHRYDDPLAGVEENLAYNAFLVGKSLLAMRVTDVVKAVESLLKKDSTAPIVLCGCRDAALVACLAAIMEPKVAAVATESLRVRLLDLLDPMGIPINAASILPGLLRWYGDVGDVLGDLAPRQMLVSRALGTLPREWPSVQLLHEAIKDRPQGLIDWLATIS